MKRKMKNKHLNANLITVLVSFFFTAVVFTGLLSGAALDKPPESNRMKPDHAPTPFSAEQIRQGCPRDRKIVFQVEAFGQPVIFQTLTFVSVYEEKVVFESVTTGMDGKQRGAKKMTVGTWKDLQSHASFPGARTKIQSESFTVPAGTFDCWRYEVTLKKGNQTNVQRYWFAKKLPGPPICFEETANGRVAYKMTMLKTGREE
ncbi:MAG: hypothetical protein JSV88_23460 [Candidatus Aminicenantes bacterium]|nr:MAG: hypothetical protein JSV88_23460 [Candidatus Aminicenantes bacterium]